MRCQFTLCLYRILHHVSLRLSVFGFPRSTVQHLRQMVIIPVTHWLLSCWICPLICPFMLYFPPHVSLHAGTMVNSCCFICSCIFNQQATVFTMPVLSILSTLTSDTLEADRSTPVSTMSTPTSGALDADRLTPLCCAPARNRQCVYVRKSVHAWYPLMPHLSILNFMHYRLRINLYISSGRNKMEDPHQHEVKLRHHFSFFQNQKTGVAALKPSLNIFVHGDPTGQHNSSCMIKITATILCCDLKYIFSIISIPLCSLWSIRLQQIIYSNVYSWLIFFPPSAIFLPI